MGDETENCPCGGVIVETLKLERVKKKINDIKTIWSWLTQTRYRCRMSEIAVSYNFSLNDIIDKRWSLSEE